MNGHALVLWDLTEEDAADVVRLLTEQRDEYRRHFRPFEYDESAIHEAIGGRTDDVYQGVYFGDTLIGLLLLRGWDEGYAVPALGILIDEAYAGTGVADAAMRMAITTARLRGAQRVMLHVDVDNYRAQRCFARHGFVVVSQDSERLRMEATIVGARESEINLRTLYDPDAATVTRSIRDVYGFEVTDRYARDFIDFVQAMSEEAGLVARE